ncbi:MAG: serine/threonine-protein kinase [Polyangiaceae bacterium]
MSRAELDVVETVLRDLGSAHTVLDPFATVRPPADESPLGVAQTLASPVAPEPVDESAGSTPPRDALFAGAPVLSIRVPTASPGASDRPRPSDDEASDIVVRELLGEGGMGRVFMAEQRSLGRRVAVKTLKRGAEAAHMRSLLSEGALTGYLEHPNIPPVHLLGVSHDGLPVLVMKLISGVAWLDLLNDENHPAWERVLGPTGERLVANLDILMHVAAAAHYAHSKGVIHRDIKPENVMIGDEGEVYLVDWGIATLVDRPRSRSLVGTPRFLAPEMITHDYLGPETDVFLLGATLHQVLTGRPRHEGATLVDVLRAAIDVKPYEYSDDVPAGLAEIANAATALDHEARPRTAAEFRNLLASYLAHRGALDLVDEAEARLEELRALRAEKRLDDPRLVRLATEARFAFEQALAMHADSERAKSGLVVVASEQLELELMRRNLSAARAIAADCEGLPAALLARLDALAAEIEAETRERERLEQLARDMDATPLRKAFARLAIVLSGTALLFFVFVHFVHRGQLTARATVFMGLGLVVILTIAIVAARRRLQESVMTRRAFAAFFGTALLMVAHRVLAYLAGESAAKILRDDLLMFSVVGLSIGVAYAHRRWFFGVAALVGGAALINFYPRAVELIFATASLFALGLLASETIERAGPPKSKP